MKKFKEFLLGTSYMWLPIAGSIVVEMILKLF